MPRARSGQAARAVVIPFTGAAHAYRRKYFTTAPAITTSNVDVSPPGNEIFSSGFLRAHATKVSTKTAASSGGTLSADDVFGFIHTVQYRQPGGQLMHGGPNFSGFMEYLANKQAGWKYVTDPKLLPSFTTGTSPQFVIRAVFEINAQTGLGSLPNQNDAAAWQLQMDTATVAAAYTTAPTTTNPTLTFDHFIECWTVPSPQNPLRPGVRQITSPPLLGTLNKWTIQQVVVAGGSTFDVDLVRKGNSIRNLGYVVCLSAAGVGADLRGAISNFPNPLTLQWDDTVIRSNDDPNLWVDDEYMIRGGAAQTTPQTPDVGVIWLKNGDPGGLDISALGLDGLGMVKQWGTTTTSTITVGGAWGATANLVKILTNDVQYVIPKANPYALAAGQPYKTNSPMPSAVT